jgi:peptidoglycan/LPS O-acetylase OafA/YrhL
METETKKQIIRWGKRILGVGAFIIWIDVIITISGSPAPFIEQAPYCMISTMIIFGILTGIFKGLDYWERVNSE